MEYGKWKMAGLASQLIRQWRERVRCAEPQTGTPQ